MSRLGWIVVAILGVAVLGGWNWRRLTEPKVPFYGQTCLSNLRQSSVALMMYQSDSDDRFPYRDAWIDAAYPYTGGTTKNLGAFHCPYAPGLWGFAFNGALDRAKTPPEAGRVPLAYDSVNLTKNASDLFKSLPAVPRHFKQNNVAYADGHAKSTKIL